MTTATHAILLVADTRPTASGDNPYIQLANSIATRTGASVQCCTAETMLLALERLVANRSNSITVVPLVLGKAHPVLRDIAGVTQWATSRWPHAIVQSAPPYAEGAMLASLFVQQLSATLAAAPHVQRKETLAIVLAPHAFDSEYHAELAGVVRELWERSAAGWVELAFLHEGVPDLHTVLHRCRNMDDRAVVVLPLTLFADAPYNGMTTAVDSMKKMAGPTELLLAPPLVSLQAATATVAMRVQQANQPPGQGHGHAFSLPPRYGNSVAVSAAPMGAADLKYDRDGQVAWNEIWGNFCDLALAGGPPHRGTLLEPATPEAVRADPNGYAQVTTELARGLRMITGRDVQTNGASGWIGLVCENEAMAIWLLRAILVENVAARREGATLFLPAGPHFRLAYEIKNVVTVVAKTHHYWQEHAKGLRTKD